MLNIVMVNSLVLSGVIRHWRSVLIRHLSSWSHVSHNILSTLSHWTQHSLLVSQVTLKLNWLLLIIDRRSISSTFEFFTGNFISLNCRTFMNRIASAGTVCSIICTVLSMTRSNIFRWRWSFITQMSTPVTKIDMQISFKKIQRFIN